MSSFLDKLSSPLLLSIFHQFKSLQEICEYIYSHIALHIGIHAQTHRHTYVLRKCETALL